MNRKDTSYYTVYPYNYCSYCHSNLMPYDYMDKYGGWNYSYYQCDCENAQIEYQMNEEIEVIETDMQKVIDKIKDKYADKLQIDYEEIKKHKFEYELEKLKEEYELED